MTALARHGQAAATPYERIALDRVEVGDQLLAAQLLVTVDRVIHEPDGAVIISGPHPTAWQFGDQIRIGWAGPPTSTVRRAKTG